VEETSTGYGNYALDMWLGRPSARTLRLDLPKFTIIGATTRIGLMSAPFVTVFGIVQRMQFYDPIDLEELFIRSQKTEIPNFSHSLKAAFPTGTRTPRIALKLLKEPGFCQVKSKEELMKRCLKRLLAYWKLTIWTG